MRNYRDSEGIRCDLTGLYNREDCCPLVEIITCKDCEHHKYYVTAKNKDGSERKMIACLKHAKEVSEDYYYADGERRE